MPRVKIAQEGPGQADVGVELARFRELDLASLRARWRTAYRRRPPDTLPRHLLFRTLAYRLQADRFGDLDPECRRLLDDAAQADGAKKAAAAGKQTAELRPGTVLGREWNGRMHRVAVQKEGFTWNGSNYQSLSKIALAITGTRWNGPRFFGLRDKPGDIASGSHASRQRTRS